MQSLGAERVPLGAGTHSLGVEHVSLGADTHSLGAIHGSLGDETQLLGVEHVSLCAETQLLGAIHPSLGAETQLLGVEHASLGAETHSLGAIHPSLGAETYSLGAETHLLSAEGNFCFHNKKPPAGYTGRWLFALALSKRGIFMIFFYIIPFQSCNTITQILRIVYITRSRLFCLSILQYIVVLLARRCCHHLSPLQFDVAISHGHPLLRKCQVRMFP